VLKFFQKPGSPPPPKKNLSGMSQYIPLSRDISTRKGNNGTIILLQQPKKKIQTTIYHTQPRDSPCANGLVLAVNDGCFDD
jgi:hypothetical protein